MMVIYAVYVINKAGTLMYHKECHPQSQSHPPASASSISSSLGGGGSLSGASSSVRSALGPQGEIERSFTHPLPFLLKQEGDRIVVAFGEADGVRGILFIKFAACTCTVSFHV